MRGQSGRIGSNALSTISGYSLTSINGVSRVELRFLPNGMKLVTHSMTGPNGAE